MNKLMQVVTVIGCWWELEKPDNKEIGLNGSKRLPCLSLGWHS